MNTNLLLVLAMGMIVSVVTTQRPGIQGILWLILILAAYVAFSFAWVFGQWHVICHVAGPILAMCLSWALITLYYQITEGRSKRVFAMRLGQYTSASLVKRIVESPSSDMLEPQARDVSCYFSDLQGFTSISEHFQPSQIVHILNIYLEHMSEVLDKHEGFINKFEGDGIFAFFNPPLNPQPKHARLACLAAIDSQKYLPHVQQHLQDIGFDLAQPLKMRIGIGTGPVVVGDCGSTRKFDYTCLGDTVNLSARLESANKFFGTAIMISQTTYKQMGDGLIARLLGRIRVVGREKALAVYELIGRDDGDAALEHFVTHFEKMVRHYWAGEFDAARAMIATLRTTPKGQTDRPLDIYTALLADTDNFLTGGIIELESK
jgi:adenylate cyclase